MVLTWAVGLMVRPSVQQQKKFSLPSVCGWKIVPVGRAVYHPQEVPTIPMGAQHKRASAAAKMLWKLETARASVEAGTASAKL